METKLHCDLFAESEEEGVDERGLTQDWRVHLCREHNREISEGRIAINEFVRTDDDAGNITNHLAKPRIRNVFQ